MFAGRRSFDELERAIAKLATEKERGDALEVFAEAYFATQKLHQAKAVYPGGTGPSELYARLNVPQNGVGIDGIYETTGDECVAYQVKFRTERVALTWNDVSSFFGVSERIQQRLIFTNSNDVAEIAEKRDGFIAVRGYDLDQLEAQDFEIIESWLRGATQQRGKNLLPASLTKKWRLRKF